MASRPGTRLGSSLSCSVLLILLFCSKPHPVARSWPWSRPSYPRPSPAPPGAQGTSSCPCLATTSSLEPMGCLVPKGSEWVLHSRHSPNCPRSFLAPAQTSQELTYEATPQGMSAFPGLPRPPVWRLQWVKGPQKQPLCPILGPTEGYSLPDFFKMICQYFKNQGITP